LVALISSVGGVGAFLGPFIVGYLNDTTRSIHSGLMFIGGSMLASALTLCCLRATVYIPCENEQLNLPEAVSTEA